MGCQQPTRADPTSHDRKRSAISTDVCQSERPTPLQEIIRLCEIGVYRVSTTYNLENHASAGVARWRANLHDRSSKRAISSHLIAARSKIATLKHEPSKRTEDAVYAFGSCSTPCTEGQGLRALPASLIRIDLEPLQHAVQFAAMNAQSPGSLGLVALALS